MVSEIETNAENAHRMQSLDIYGRIDEARDDWRRLSACAPSSPYQQYAFVEAWQETIGRARGFTPMIVVARDSGGAPLALLPLATRRIAGLRVAEFLCGRDSNFNLGLIRPGAKLDFRNLLLAAARAHAAAPDIFYLRNQPLSVEGAENPLAAIAACPSPSFAYGRSLPTDCEALERGFSKSMRKKLRQKSKRLTECGDVSFDHDAKGARAGEILYALATQKAARLANLGVSDGGGFETPEMRAFLRRLAEADLLETHALSLSGRIIATYVGLAHRGRFSTLANSFDMAEDAARHSPGDLLLQALLRHCVQRGLAYFDLGVGEARYKDAVCDETIALCDGVLPATALGALAAPALRGFLAAKRFAKQTPQVARTIAAARRAAARL
jgi:CelD/BcsL family acetyltransferase involved in cellulose biosynthesis